jgi:hypothetical protein
MNTHQRDAELTENFNRKNFDLFPKRIFPLAWWEGMKGEEVFFAGNNISVSSVPLW